MGVASNETNMEDSVVVTVVTYGSVETRIVVPSCALVNRMRALVALPATRNSILLLCVTGTVVVDLGGSVPLGISDGRVMSLLLHPASRNSMASVTVRMTTSVYRNG